MSGYAGHAIAYLLAAVPATFLAQQWGLLDVGVTTIVAALFIGLFYSILPDIDTPSSKARRIIGRTLLALTLASLIGFLARAFGEKAIYFAATITFFLYVLWFVKHRGILHTPLAAIIFSAPLLALNPVFAGYAFLGFMSHLIIDREVFH